MATFEDERLATNARYITSRRELELALDDRSRHLVLVDRLEMVEEVSDSFAPIAKPIEEQLSDVKVLEQRFCYLASTCSTSLSQSGRYVPSITDKSYSEEM